MEHCARKPFALIVSWVSIFLPLVSPKALCQGVDPASSTTESREKQVQPSVPALPAQPGPKPDYVIGAEDVLDVDVYDYPDLTKTSRVANDGTITLPLVGEVQAAGLTAQQLGKELESKFSQSYLVDPKITVWVKEFHARPVSLVGQVERPGLINLTGRRNLIEMISLAGGPSKTAGKTVLVTRRGGFGDLELAEGMRLVAPDQLEVNLKQLLYSHEGGLNIEIRPLDTITISRADIIYVVGAVKNSAGFVMADRENVTVLEALAMAGGLYGGASKKRTLIIRRHDDGSREEIPVNLGKLLKGKSPDVQMAANDILFVPSSAGKEVAKQSAGTAMGVISGLVIYGRI